MISNLEYRRKVCADESLQERVAQALLEAGKTGVVASVVAGVVLASLAVGDKVEVSTKELGPAISDDEIIAYVAGMA